MPKRSTLGSVIATYKHKYNRKGNKKYNPSQQHEILNVIKRLEDYKKYEDKVKEERRNAKKKQFNKLLKKVKKDSYKKAYSIKPVHNPYIHMYTKHSIVPDPTLMKRYQSKNIYSMYEFRHLKLPNSGYNIKAGHAWGGLIKAWNGYRIAKAHDNKDKMRLYGSATQMFVHLLELPMMPDFPSIGLPKEGFKKNHDTLF